MSATVSRLLVTTLVGTTGTVVLLSRTSADPWLMNRYSLPDLVFGALGVVFASYLAYLVHRFRWDGIKIIAAMVGVGLLVVLLLGVAARLYTASRPGYRVIHLEPDREVGWKQLPNHEWTWTGAYWYARDFRVDVKTNSHGFRDRERTLEKPADHVRIAVLGDSFVEAAQVPMEKTATALLEDALNQDPGPGSAHEVLNFGISNYGVGQYLLVYEAYASHFDPDRVVVFVARFHFDRTVKRHTPGAYASTRDRSLRVRPTFRLEDDVLVREAAADFATYQKLHGQQIASHGRQSLIPPQPFWSSLAEWNPRLPLAGLQAKLKRRDADSSAWIPPEAPDAVFLLNLRILRELKERVEASGARLDVIDAFEYFASGPKTRWESGLLRSFCAEHGIGYRSVATPLLRANASGVATRWTYDGHFNVAGNRILAETLYELVRPQSDMNTPASGDR